jgi:hypothetical protein
MAKEMSLKDFVINFFDKRTQTRGNRNPVRIKQNKDALEKSRIRTKKEIAAGAHDSMLNTCAISGMRGKFDSEIQPAQIRISKQGGFDTLRVLIHKEIQVGMEYDGRTVLSIERGFDANIKMFQVDDVSFQPYVHIYTTTSI